MRAKDTTCPRCPSQNISIEARDTEGCLTMLFLWPLRLLLDFTPILGDLIRDLGPDRRKSPEFRDFYVCEDCYHEWPVEEPEETESPPKRTKRQSQQSGRLN